MYYIEVHHLSESCSLVIQYVTDCWLAVWSMPLLFKLRMHPFWRRTSMSKATLVRWFKVLSLPNSWINLLLVCGFRVLSFYLDNNELIDRCSYSCSLLRFVLLHLIFLVEWLWMRTINFTEEYDLWLRITGSTWWKHCKH